LPLAVSLCSVGLSPPKVSKGKIKFKMGKEKRSELKIQEAKEFGFILFFSIFNSVLFCFSMSDYQRIRIRNTIDFPKNQLVIA
jgi:hypothetical protein